MRSFVIGVVGVGLLLSVPAHAAPARDVTAYYVAPGGAAVGSGTLYGSTSTGNVGEARVAVPSGQKQVRLTVTDSSQQPVAVRVEAYRAGRIDVLVACAAGSLGPVRISGATELRVLPLAGACASGSGIAVSAPTSGQVVFSFTR
jgi:hypothetical protein